MPDHRLAAVLRLSRRGQGLLAGFRRSYSHDEALERLVRAGLSMVAIGDRDYPARLAESHDPPVALFLAGDPSRLKEFTGYPRIAIVGSRDATGYGRDAARHIATGLSRNSVCVVSGMAFGIDTVAHQSALAEDGATIAVLGCGPETAYPRSSRRLYAQILERGLVVSEYPPGTEPRPWRFPARNRIIAGLTFGVVVVEAAAKSGALITADFCLEQGGEVCAVPGSIFSRQSEGTNRLIREGAASVSSAEDVMDALGLDVPAPEKENRDAGLEELGEVEKRVMGVLGARPLPVDVIAGRAGTSAAAAVAALTALELMGRVRFEPGRGYSA